MSTTCSLRATFPSTRTTPSGTRTSCRGSRESPPCRFDWSRGPCSSSSSSVGSAPRGLRTRRKGSRRPTRGGAGEKQDDIPQEAVDVYERNLRSTIGVAHSRGARTLLVAQTARLRPGHEGEDRAWLEGWTPGLTSAGYLAGLARYNAVSKKLGAEGAALFLDPFADGAFGDASFTDPVHFSPEGSDRFARALASFLTSPAGPLAPR